MLRTSRRGKTRCWPVLLLLLAVTGCGRASKDLPDVVVEMVVSPEPAQIGPSTVTVTLVDANGELIENADLELEANMSHAGMVPVFASAREVAPGRYEAPLEFTMGGDWFVLVRSQLPDGRSLERRIDLPGVDVLCGETPTP
jgi:hypothetical protein